MQTQLFCLTTLYSVRYWKALKVLLLLLIFVGNLGIITHSTVMPTRWAERWPSNSDHNGLWPDFRNEELNKRKQALGRVVLYCSSYNVTAMLQAWNLWRNISFFPLTRNPSDLSQALKTLMKSEINCDCWTFWIREIKHVCMCVKTNAICMQSCTSGLHWTSSVSVCLHVSDQRLTSSIGVFIVFNQVIHSQTGNTCLIYNKQS